MGCPIVKRHIIVQRGIDGSSPQPQGNCEQTKQKQIPGAGKAKQRRSGQRSGKGGDPSGTEAPDQLRRQQAGYDGSPGNQHGDQASSGNRNPELRINGRPGSPEQRVRNAQSDKSNINDKQKQCSHSLKSPVSYVCFYTLLIFIYIRPGPLILSEKRPII